MSSPTTRPARTWLRVGPAPLLLLLAYTLLAGAWIATNPPGFAPDEPAHYIKAVGIGHGEVRGLSADYSYLPTMDEQMLRWQNANSRSVEVPRGLGACLYFRLPIDGRCPEGLVPPTPAREITYVGAYPPFAYIGMAAAMRLGHSTYTALLLGRAASAALSLALLAGALWAICRGRRRPLALLGLVVTVTPMVLFISAELSTSGAEITAGICFAATLLRFADDPRPPRRLWLLALVSGVVLAISRQFGPIWVLIDLAWFTALVGRWPAGAVLRRGGGWSVATVGALVAAAMADLAWQARFSPRPHVGREAVTAGIRFGRDHWRDIAGEAIGSFGWTDVPLPHAASVPWVAMGVLLLMIALRHATTRERWVLGGLVAALVATTLTVAVAVAAASPRFAMQARYVMPVGVALPLLAGEIAQRHRDRIRADLTRILLPAGLVVAAVVQAVSLAVNAQNYRDDPHGYLSFIEPRHWEPSGGWAPWVIVVAVAALLLGGVAVDAWRGEGSRTSGGSAGAPPISAEIRA